MLAFYRMYCSIKGTNEKRCNTVIKMIITINIILLILKVLTFFY